jgi:hypothetical protein
LFHELARDVEAKTRFGVKGKMLLVGRAMNVAFDKECVIVEKGYVNIHVECGLAFGVRCPTSGRSRLVLTGSFSVCQGNVGKGLNEAITGAL